MTYNPTGLETSKQNIDVWKVTSLASTGPTGMKRFEWHNTKISEYRGFYKTIPELNRTINLYAIWTIGQGFSADPETKVILDHITGRGNQTFMEILWNMLVQTKIYGDAYAEIIRDKDTGTLLNLKVLDPATIKIIANEKGIIEGYEQISKFPENKGTKVEEFKPEEIFHLSNEGIDDEIHGESVIEACRKVIEYRNQAMADKAWVLHMSSIRVIEVETDDLTKIAELEKTHEKAINTGRVMIFPKGSVNVPDIPKWTHDSDAWIAYLEDFFYQAVGIPKPLTGGSQGYTESSSKIAMASQEQPNIWDGKRLSEDIWNQLLLRVEFHKAVSITEDLSRDNMKDSGQMNVGMNQAGIEE